MQRALPFWLFLMVFVVSGCDPVFGVSRRARVSFMPEPTQVRAVIRATPGVHEVEYRPSQGGRPLTLTGVKPPDQVHTFFYQGRTNVHGIVQFTVDYKQTVEYSQYLMSIHGRPPQAWIDATYPVMIEIEKQLEETCGLTNLQSSVVEDWSGVKRK